MHRGLRACWLALLGAAYLAHAAPATASGLQVSPISVTLRAEQNADGLWLSNTGQTALHAQVRVFRWTQENGEEKLLPTQELAISPPMLALPPGERQLVRVIRLGPPPQEVEASYRVIVDELPLETVDAKNGLQFVLRYSIPVFLSPPGELPLASALRTRLDLSETKATLEIDNAGKVHAQIADLVFIDTAGQRHAIAPGLLGYALPGRRMRWPLAHPSSLFANGGTFKARINGEAAEQPLLLDSAAR
jgi:fimbrial chaperone protein